MKLQYNARVEDGKLLVSNKAKMVHELREELEGKPVTITIEKKRKKRSNQQNAYIWGVLYPAALEALNEAGNYGLNINDIHEFFKKRYLDNGKEIVLPETGEVLKMEPSTTYCTVGEMMEYIMEIQKFLSEFFGYVVQDMEMVE